MDGRGVPVRLREVDTVAIDEFHLKVEAPHSRDVILEIFISGEPHPRINVGDRVEHMVLDKSKLTESGGLVVTCVHHSVEKHLGKTIMTTRLETED
jgi:hypothetical protein